MYNYNLLRIIDKEAADWPVAPWTAPALYPRQTASSTTTAAPTTTSDAPYFPDPATASVQANPDGAVGRTGGLAKAVLEYVILAVGLLVFFCFVLRRLTRLRRANQPSSFFSLSSFRSTDQYLPSHRRQYPRTHGLPRVDLTYPSPSHTRPIRSNDIDPFGRRLTPGDLNDKDQLPPYDTTGGPPKYFELNHTGANRSGFDQPASLSTENCPTSEAAADSGNHTETREQNTDGTRPPDDDQAQQSAGHSESSPPGLSTLSAPHNTDFGRYQR